MNNKINNNSRNLNYIMEQDIEGFFIIFIFIYILDSRGKDIDIPKRAKW